MAFCRYVSEESLDLVALEAYRQILFVCKDQKQSIPQLVLIQHALQLLTGLNDTIAVIAINDENDALGILEVMPPQRSDLILSSHIPNGELNVFIFDSFDIEALEMACLSIAKFDVDSVLTGLHIPIVGMVVTISPSFSL